MKIRYGRRRDTADHHVLPLTLVHRYSSQTRHTSGTPQAAQPVDEQADEQHGNDGGMAHPSRVRVEATARRPCFFGVSMVRSQAAMRRHVM
jgi:hypothetical protein